MKHLPIKLRAGDFGEIVMFGKRPKAGEQYTFTLSVNGSKARIKNFVREKSTNQTKTK